jgi:hypothetical protein
MRDKIEVMFTLAGPRIFAVQKYADAIERVVERKDIKVGYRHNLVEIRAASKEAVYRHMDSEEEIVLNYDMIHVTPPMGAPDFVASSEFAGEGGWVAATKAILEAATLAGHLKTLGNAPEPRLISKVLRQSRASTFAETPETPSSGDFGIGMDSKSQRSIVSVSPRESNGRCGDSFDRASWPFRESWKPRVQVKLTPAPSQVGSFARQRPAEWTAGGKMM